MTQRTQFIVSATETADEARAVQQLVVARGEACADATLNGYALTMEPLDVDVPSADSAVAVVSSIGGTDTIVMSATVDTVAIQATTHSLNDVEEASAQVNAIAETVRTDR